MPHHDMRPTPSCVLWGKDQPRAPPEKASQMAPGPAASVIVAYLPPGTHERGDFPSGTQSLGCFLRSVHRYAHAQTPSHTHSHAYGHMHSHMITCTHDHSRARGHTHDCTPALTHNHRHSHVHGHMHTHDHTPALAQSHTSTCSHQAGSLGHREGQLLDHALDAQVSSSSLLHPPGVLAPPSSGHPSVFRSAFLTAQPLALPIGLLDQPSFH